MWVSLDPWNAQAFFEVQFRAPWRTPNKAEARSTSMGEAHSFKNLEIFKKAIIFKSMNNLTLVEIKIIRPSILIFHSFTWSGWSIPIFPLATGHSKSKRSFYAAAEICWAPAVVVDESHSPTICCCSPAIAYEFCYVGSLAVNNRLNRWSFDVQFQLPIRQLIRQLKLDSKSFNDRITQPF